MACDHLLSTPAFSVLAIFMGNRNDLFWPLIITNSDEIGTPALGLMVMSATHLPQRGRVMAAAIFAVIPVIVFHSLFQRRIIEGGTMTEMAGG